MCWSYILTNLIGVSQIRGYHDDTTTIKLYQSVNYLLGISSTNLIFFYTWNDQTLFMWMLKKQLHTNVLLLRSHSAETITTLQNDAPMIYHYLNLFYPAVHWEQNQIIIKLLSYFGPNFSCHEDVFHSAAPLCTGCSSALTLLSKTPWTVKKQQNLSKKRRWKINCDSFRAIYYFPHMVFTLTFSLLLFKYKMFCKLFGYYNLNIYFCCAEIKAEIILKPFLTSHRCAITEIISL